MLWISFTKQDRLTSGRLSRTSSLKRWFCFLRLRSWDFQAWQLAKVALGQKTQVRRREDCARRKVNAFQQVEAFQLGVRLPYDYFELLHVTNTSLSSYTEADNFGLTKLEENAVRTLWFDENGSTLSLQNNSTLFTLEVRAKQAIANLQSVLKLDNSILTNEFWQTGTPTEPVSLTVSVEVMERTDGNTAKGVLQEKKEPLQCYPNPFTNNILLTYVHEGQSTQGALSITNASGVEIYRQLLSIEQGENTLTITSLKDAPKGMYTVSLNLNGKTHAANLVKK